MEYWEGYMNWPLQSGWVCETCKEYRGLTWGLIHAQCRCNQCHTQYHMRDKDEKVVNVPICMLKEEYKSASKKAWTEYHKPIDTLTDDEWDSVM